MNVSGFEILNKIDNKDAGFCAQILPKVRRKWDRLVAQPGVGTIPQGMTMIEAVVKEDGSTEQIRTTESSGDQSLDAIAFQAVATAGPFPAFPPDFHERELHLRFHFGYAQPVTAVPVCGPFHPIGKAVIAPNGPVKPPKATLDPDPEYPDQARRAKYQGMVIIGGVVDEKGSFRDPCLRQGAGVGLDEKAIETVKTWKFEPASRDGTPVSVYIEVQVDFRLY